MFTLLQISIKPFLCEIFQVVADCVDTDLHESEKAFESEFNKLYGDKDAEQKAAAALAANEKQV